jgi:hypothetical protein
MKLTKILENIITEKFDAQEAITYMQSVIKGSGISDTAADQMTDILTSMSVEEIKVLRQKFQSMKIEDYIKGGWKTFEEFFPIKGEKTGTGRGELMAVMAIKGAFSGGTGEKDLQIDGVGTYEVKEDPNNIRMAKSGFAGLFDYTPKIKEFYKLLDKLNLNNPSNDKILLDSLKKSFNNDSVANEVFKTLTVNFRGDGFKTSKESTEDNVTESNFFARAQIAAEIPSGVIQLQFDGFIKLRELRDDILKNSDLIKNAKMLVKFKDIEAEYWISGEDAEELKNAKPNAEVSIKKGVNVNKGDNKVFMYNLIEIFKHPYTVNPIEISDDFSKRKNEYFGEVKGILYYMEGNPEPHIGQKNEFVVYAISQNMGKLRMKRNNEVGWIANQT